MVSTVESWLILWTTFQRACQRRGPGRQQGPPQSVPSRSSARTVRRRNPDRPEGRVAHPRDASCDYRGNLSELITNLSAITSPGETPSRSHMSKVNMRVSATSSRAALASKWSSSDSQRNTSRSSADSTAMAFAN